MKKGIKKFISSPLFKKLVVAGAVAAAAAGTAALVNTFKKNQGLLPGKSAKILPNAKNIYISGDSIASLAAAAYLIKDGGYDGSSIHIYGTPSPTFLAEEYGSIGPCFRELMAAIDAHTDDDFCIDTLLDNMSYSAAPEVKVIDITSGVRDLELKPDKAVLKALAKALKKLSSSSADELDNTSIAEYFADIPRFFESDLFSFIEMTFGIRAEHKVKEFLERVEQLITYAPKAGLYDTLYYDFSVVSVLEDYLEENGVKILRNAELIGANIDNNAISAIHLIDDGTRMTIYLNKEDLVIVNVGNLADNRSEGSFGECAPIIEDAPQSSALWSDLASKDDSFGIPELLLENPSDSTEFSIVDNNGYLLKKICSFLGCKPDNGISALFEASNWRMKLTSEPYSFGASVSDKNISDTVNGALDTSDDSDEADVTHDDINAAIDMSFPDENTDSPQPVISVKGVYSGSEGNFIDKTMRECTGVEMLYELCCHLGLLESWDEVLENISLVIVGNYPYKTAPLRKVGKHALPELRPCSNCVLVSDFIPAEAPSCTLEQEIQSARKAAYSIIGKKEKSLRPKVFDIKRL